MFELTKLTLGEVARVEELSGRAITSITNDDSPKGLTMAALALVIKRREDPDFSWNKAQALTFEEANTILGIGQDTEDEPSPLAQPVTPDQ